MVISYDRTISFKAVIVDFHDGSDTPLTGSEDPLREKITIVPATARSAGVDSNAKGPTAESIWLENPDNHFLLKLTAPRRGLDPSNWEASSAAVIHFGDPTNDGREESLWMNSILAPSRFPA